MNPRAVAVTTLVVGMITSSFAAETPVARKVAGGFTFTEGPVWMPDGSVVFSDIPANRLHRWSAKDGATVFREPSGKANGNTLDREGRLVTCEHATRRVSRTEADGTVTTLAAEFEGRPFNSPNDVVVRSDGTIWFTDPTYGAEGRTDGQGVRGVYRLVPETGAVTRVAADFDQPNGLCFSPDEAKLYVADSGRPAHVRVFTVREDGTLEGGGVFAKIAHGVPDGMRVARDGDVYVSEERGISVFAPDGTFRRLLPVPETPTNLGFSADGNTLYVTARTGLYEIAL